MADWLYHYPPLLSGRLLRRYKRFFADIQLDSGQVITAHCPNTGPMTGISTPESPVQVSVSDNPRRKLPYTWEMIQVAEPQPTWVGVNTQVPNRVVRALLEQRQLTQLGDYQQIRAEVPYGQEKSRVDFLLEGEAILPTYVEVKSATWAAGKRALFPDTVTTRGQKHIRELQALLPAARGYLLYFINRGDCLEFAPGDQADPTYGQLLRLAIAAGIEILPCRFEITPTGIQYLGLATLKIAEPD